MLAVLEHGTAPKSRTGRHGGKKARAADFVATLEGASGLCAEGLPVSALERLFLFDILRDAGRRIPAALAAKLWRIALMSAIEQVARERSTSDSSASERLIDADLNWQAGLLFTHVSGAAQMAAAAREELGRILLESSDQDGVPSAEIVEDLPNRLATLVRPGVGSPFREPFI